MQYGKEKYRQTNSKEQNVQEFVNKGLRQLKRLPKIQKRRQWSLN